MSISCQKYFPPSLTQQCMVIASLAKNALLLFVIAWFSYCVVVANISKLMILSHGGKIGCAFYWDIDF